MASLLNLVILALAISMTSAQDISIYMSGRELPDMDPFDSAPDALLYVYFKETGGSYISQGATNYIPNNNNPDWSERYTFTYTGGYTQMFKLDVYDADSPDSDDYMGYVEFAFGDLYNAPNRRLELDIISGNPGGGKIIVSAGPGLKLNPQIQSAV